MYQGSWHENEALLTEKFIDISAFIREEARSQTNDLSLPTKNWENVEQRKPKVKRRGEVINKE